MAKGFNNEICYIESVIYSKEFEKLSFKEKKEKLREVLEMKLKEAFHSGVIIGEHRIKTQLEKINYSTEE